MEVGRYHIDERDNAVDCPEMKFEHFFYRILSKVDKQYRNTSTIAFIPIGKE